MTNDVGEVILSADRFNPAPQRRLGEPLMPEIVHDLPAGARRLMQKSRGILATVVNGGVLMRGNEHTGELPGQLLRGPLAASR